MELSSFTHIVTLNFFYFCCAGSGNTQVWLVTLMQLKYVHLTDYCYTVEMRASDWILVIVVLRFFSYNSPATALLLLGLFQLADKSRRFIAPASFHLTINKKKKKTPAMFTYADCSAVFTTKRLFRRHRRTHAAQWERPLTPTKVRQWAVITIQEYQRRSLDPLGLLDDSDENTSKDPR